MRTKENTKKRQTGNETEGPAKVRSFLLRAMVSRTGGASSTAPWERDAAGGSTRRHKPLRRPRPAAPEGKLGSGRGENAEAVGGGSGGGKEEGPSRPPSSSSRRGRRKAEGERKRAGEVEEKGEERRRRRRTAAAARGRRIRRAGAVGVAAAGVAPVPFREREYKRGQRDFFFFLRLRAEGFLVGRSARCAL